MRESLSGGNPILLTKENKKNKKGEEKRSSVGEPLTNFWLFPSVSGTEIIKKDELSGGTS